MLGITAARSPCPWGLAPGALDAPKCDLGTSKISVVGAKKGKEGILVLFCSFVLPLDVPLLLASSCFQCHSSKHNCFEEQSYST